MIMSISLKIWLRGPGNHSNTNIQGFIEGEMAPKQKSKSDFYLDSALKHSIMGKTKIKIIE